MVKEMLGTEIRIAYSSILKILTRRAEALTKHINLHLDFHFSSLKIKLFSVGVHDVVQFFDGKAENSYKYVLNKA